MWEEDGLNFLDKMLSTSWLFLALLKGSPHKKVSISRQSQYWVQDILKNINLRTIWGTCYLWRFWSDLCNDEVHIKKLHQCKAFKSGSAFVFAGFCFLIYLICFSFICLLHVQVVPKELPLPLILTTSHCYGPFRTVWATYDQLLIQTGPKISYMIHIWTQSRELPKG